MYKNAMQGARRQYPTKAKKQKAISHARARARFDEQEKQERQARMIAAGLRTADEYEKKAQPVKRRPRRGKKAGPFFKSDRHYNSNASFNGSLLRG